MILILTSLGTFLVMWFVLVLGVLILSLFVSDPGRSVAGVLSALFFILSVLIVNAYM